MIGLGMRQCDLVSATVPASRDGSPQLPAAPAGSGLLAAGIAAGETGALAALFPDFTIGRRLPDLGATGVSGVVSRSDLRHHGRSEKASCRTRGSLSAVRPRPAARSSGMGGHDPDPERDSAGDDWTSIADRHPQPRPAPREQWLGEPWASREGGGLAARNRIAPPRRSVVEYGSRSRTAATGQPCVDPGRPQLGQRQ